MEKKKLIALIGIIVVAIVAIAIAIVLINKNNKESDKPDKPDKPTEPAGTGSFKKSSYTSNGVSIEITSTEPGHPSGDAKFNVSIEIDKGENDDLYDVSYFEVEDGLDENATSTVKINGKTFFYYIKEIGFNEADLYYPIPKYQNKYLHIKVIGTFSFDDEGNMCKCIPMIDREVLTSDELAGVLNFETYLIVE